MAEVLHSHKHAQQSLDASLASRDAVLLLQENKTLGHVSRAIQAVVNTALVFSTLYWLAAYYGGYTWHSAQGTDNFLRVFGVPKAVRLWAATTQGAAMFDAVHAMVGTGTLAICLVLTVSNAA